MLKKSGSGKYERGREKPAEKFLTAPVLPSRIIFASNDLPMNTLHPVSFVWRILPGFLYLIWCMPLAAQTDSLEQVLPALQGREKVIALGELTFQYAYTDGVKALEYGNRELALAQELNDPEMLALAYNDLSIAYFYKGRFDTVVVLNKKALAIREKLGDLRGMASSLNKMGNAYHELGDLGNAMRVQMRTLQVYESLQDTFGMETTLNNIGNVLHRNKNYMQAIPFFERALTLARQIGDKRGIIAAKGNLANALLALKRYRRSEKEFRELIVLIEESGYPEQLAVAYQGLGVIYRDQMQHEKGIGYYLKALEIYEKIGSEVGIGTICINLGNAWKDAGDGQKAAYYLQKGLQISETQATPYQLKLAYNGMYDYEKQRGNTASALHYLEKLNAVKDSIYNTETSSLIAEMNARYQTEHSRKEVAERDLALADSELKRRNVTILALASAGGLAFVLVLFYFFYKRQQVRKKIMEQEKCIELERERFRISRDLHDNLGAELTLISFLADGHPGGKDEAVPADEMEKIGKHTRSAMAQLRETIWAIHEENTPVWQLADKIREHARKMFDDTGAEVRVKSDETGLLLKPNQTLHIYRVCQEVINNAAKYSGCSVFTADIQVREPFLYIHLHDNGRGFDARGNGTGYGLGNMQSRMAELGGSFELESAVGNGTHVWLRIPV